MRLSRLSGLLAVAVVLTGAAPAQAAAPSYRNCTALHEKYEHGVARAGARDKVRGSTKPVTTFAVSTAVYQANRKLDRDKDGVACEQR